MEDAQFSLASLLEEKGEIEEAIKYYKLAAEQGDFAAAENLAILFKDAGNFAEAEKYYRLAAELGEPNALRELEKMTNEKTIIS